MNRKQRNIGIRVVLLAFLLLAGQWLLGEDGGAFFRWWLAALFLGIGMFPVTGYLFSHFRDKGWLVSKVLGIAAAGFLTWLLVNCRILPFTGMAGRSIAILLAVTIWCFWFLGIQKGEKKKVICEFFSRDMIAAALEGEIVFTLFFLLWTYAAGFRPAAYGTEKFMDYGFMMAMMRSIELPAKDLWYAGEPINYYYGGQYFAVWLTKLTSTQVAQTYHLMRTLVAGFAFALPFTLVRQMLLDRKQEGKKEGKAVLGGILAGAGVSLAGNMHYVVVGKLLPWIRKVFALPEGDYTYWFPNSTRYIGYYPEGNDKTIHEFPSYSFVLGDLHAHVVNVLFVLAVICLVYAMVQRYRWEKENTRKKLTNLPAKGLQGGWGLELRRTLTEPYVWGLAFFIGLFHWTNYWDFVIYYVMGGMGVIYCNFLRFQKSGDRKERIRLTAIHSGIHAVWVFLWGSIFALPFTLQFETMVSGIALAQNHSRPYQWWLVWGLQFLMTLLFFWCVFRDHRKKGTEPETVDFFGIILGISAIGLILIPEIVYVRDIYEKEYARSNTMFKLTYQAFIMFGILLGYVFVRFWMEKKQWIRKLLGTVGFVCFVGCCCYIGTAVHSWFGEVWDKDQYQGLDATAFLESEFPEDAGAIRWLNEHVEGNPVVLEANGDSYSDYERVSAMTGLPTILGWYVHEWLWRGGIEDLNLRGAEVETIYTSNDQAVIENLLRTYQVEYIFVGSMEREKYPQLNEEMIQKRGEIVYRDAVSNTYIVKVMDWG